MKAAVLYEANKPLVIEDLEQDPPKMGEVRIKTGASGVCASDHHIMTGVGTLPMPIVLGHEGAGTVVEVGPGVTRVKPGDRCILSFVSNCGHCRTCRTGFPNLCDTNRKTGARLFDGTSRLHKGKEDIFQMAKIGVFAETLVVPEQACHPIPAEVPMEIAALIGCSVTTGVGAVINNPAVKAGSTVAVFGCGGVGLNVIQGAKLINARRIIAVDIFDHKLEFTYKFGATDVINSREQDPVKAIHELTDGGVDVAIDSFGGAVTTAAAVASLRRTGTAILVGLAPEGATAPINMVDLVRGQKTLVGSYYGSASPHESFAKIVDFYLKSKLDLDSLVTRRYKLEEINEGFDALARGEDGRG
ncbi:MAG: Zn-dependent alcohol dehydrogenase, partial [Chloroflexi bacterium]|nr:Zn-dependent alcohol dehydrogenase [Chloroflexota bacterium]